jgi:hypothetical protein
MYPGARVYAASETLGCIHASDMPALVELPDGAIAVVHYSSDCEVTLEAAGLRE